MSGPPPGLNRAPDARTVPSKCTGDYTAAHAAARESSASRNAARGSRLTYTSRMHAPELPDAATVHIRGGSRGGRGGRGASASGRGRRGHSRTRAHSKSLVCYVRPPGAATGHRCRPATPKRPQQQRASTARITLVVRIVITQGRLTPEPKVVGISDVNSVEKGNADDKNYSTTARDVHTVIQPG